MEPQKVPAPKSALPKAETEAARASRIYETILATTDDFIYIFDTKGRFLYANARLLKVWAKTLDQIVGKTCHELGYPIWHADMHMREIEQVVHTKTSIRGEVPFTGDSGISGVYDYIFKPVFNSQGEVDVIVGTTRDVTDRKRDEEKSDFLSHLTQKLSTVADASEINRIATEQIGLFLKVPRCYFFEVLPGADRVRVLPDWRGKNEASLEGEYTATDFGSPEFTKALSAGSFSVENVKTHPWTKKHAANYEPLNLVAYAFAPFIRDKRWVASIGVASDRPRHWTDDEISLLENAASRVWPLIERANLEGILRLGEEALSRIAAIVESSDDAIIGKTLEGFITSWNQGAERIFGYTAKEAIGQHIFLLIPPELHNEEPGIIARLKRGERIEHYETIRMGKDGRRVDISLSVSPVRDRMGNIVGASKIARDITEEKKRQDALKESELRFRSLADSAPMLIWEAGTDQLCHYFNQTWLHFVGRTLEQEFGMGWLEGVHPDDKDRCIQIYVIAFEARTAFEMEYRLRHHSGQYRWISDNGSPRFGPNGTFQGYIGACADIDEAVRARQNAVERREELQRLVDERTSSLQEAVAQMEEFSYSVSHDLRAPLRAMQGYATMLLEEYKNKPLDAEAEDYLQRIITAGVRMDRLTREVLVYSKIPRAQMKLQAVSLDHLVSDIVQQYRQSKDRSGDITVETPLLPVLGNESFLAQAVSNLVDNAVKFAAKDRPLSVRLHTEQRGKQVRLWVEDNGIGIKPEHQARIWGMFERVHPQDMYEGTGIGLAIVRKTVERMNGAMGIESDGITGSRFWIQLPGV